MSQLRIAASLVFGYVLSACAPHGAAPPAEDTAASPPPDVQQSAPRGAPSPGKPGAPVKVAAEIHAKERRAAVTVDVGREARDLEVSVRGLDGVTILEPSAPVRAASAPAGEKITIDVSFSNTAPSGTLVVEVRGSFAGRTLGAVRTFSIGAPPAAGPKEPPRTDASGRPVVVLPAE